MSARLSEFRPVRNVRQSQIAREWDAIAKTRVDQISSKRDVSARHVLLPMMRAMTADVDRTNVLDIGCGTGFIVSELSRTMDRIMAIDVSGASIEQARSLYSGRKNLRFAQTSVERHARTEATGGYTLATANMVLMTAVNLRRTLAAINSLLQAGGHLVLTITHPWFWPEYWGYAKAPWFSYDREIAIEAPFAISWDLDGALRTTHIHRPLHAYFDAMVQHGFEVETLVEPFPSQRVQRMYPKPWVFPRFLGMRCKKV